MNGLEKITARIAQTADAEAERIQSEANAEYEEIRARGEQAAQEEYWRLVRTGVKDCEKRVQRLGSTAELEAKKSLLALKQELVAESFAEAAKKLAAMPKAEKTEFLSRLAAQAALTGKEELIFNKADRRAIGEAVAEKANAALAERGLPNQLRVSAECREISGGLIVREGDIECNCSIEALIELYRSDLSMQVAGVLFA